ncbi:transglutaminase-like domain-containing protein [Kangiella marina]|uniref:Transglutaminase-like domain-containing protein n=1 Tax=Kangiella marina TaxID=1079178 RepID=A0ABP8IAP6_9GAMM
MKSTVSTLRNTLLKLILLAAALLLVSSYSPFQRLWDSASPKSFTEWYQINWQGQVVGWAKKSLEQTSDYYKVTAVEHFEGRVRGQRVKFIYQHTYFFDKEAPYNVVKGSAKLVEPQLTMTTQFYNNEALRVEQVRNDIASNVIEPQVSYHLDDYLAKRQWIEGQPTKGDSLTFLTLNPHSLSTSPEQLTVTRNPSGRHQHYQLQTDSGKRFELSLQGQVLVERRDRGIELVASKHKPSFNPEMQSDLYSNIGLPSNKPLGDIYKVKSLVLQLNEKTADWLTVHPTATKDKTSLIIQSGASHKSTPDEVNHWRFEPISDIVDKIQPDLSEVVNDKDKVNHLVKFVHDYLYYQPTPTSFTTEEVITNGYGDCTEYTQLLLALLNAQRIPAREVSGYIYLGDDEQRFGGHAWVEALIDGQWVGVDPTWNLTSLTAGHLPITIPQEKSVSDLDFTVEQIHYK